MHVLLHVDDAVTIITCYIINIHAIVKLETYAWTMEFIRGKQNELFS